MKCVAYCRVSSDSTEQMNSLENQIKHYTELFNKKGFTGAECGMYYSKENKNEVVKYIPAIFADEGISGTKLKNRGAFNYMLECAYRKEFDVILVKNVQRWARNVEDGAGILKKLKVMGIKVIFEDGWLDSLNPANEATINILFVMAQEESRAKSTAVQFGIRKAQESGKFTSALPYGYKNNKGYLEPVKDQLEVVQKIFQLYLEGWGSTKIVKYLNGEKIPTQKSKSWSTTQIFNIITNAIYTGKQITHRQVNTDINLDRFVHEGQVYKSRKPVAEDEWIVNQREELRVISDEVYEKAQIEYFKRKKMHGTASRPSNASIFSNLLYCRNCGRAMRRKKLWGLKRKDGTRKIGVEWVCMQHDKYHNEICRYRNSWHEDALVAKVKNEIEKLRTDKSTLDKMFIRYMQSFFSSEEVTGRISGLQGQLDEIKTEASANLKLFAKNIIDEEQYKQQNGELQYTKKMIEAELSKLKRIDQVRNEIKIKYNSYVDFINSIDFDNLNNTLLKRVISKIEAYTITDKHGNATKGIYINWNMLDKTFDDVLYSGARE
ncbi:MAG TPA: recombinase family protein [Ruminiclostridium sp.]|nr:recombinase family protein [Ruminiclostridium sp.]